MRVVRVMLAISLLLTSSVVLAGEDSVLGTWLTDGGKSKIDIEHCGDKLCGKISWLKEPNFPAGDKMAGQAKVDRNNPDESLRSRPLLGLELLKGFHYDKDNVWKGGTIYDPRNGKTYSCKMTLENDHTLKVRGYVGISLFGRTVIWTR